MEATFDLLTLAFVPRLSPRGARELLARGSLRSTLAQASDHADLLGPHGLEALRSGAAQRAAEAETQATRRLGIEIVGCDEDRYPQWLRRTHTPPLVLWVQGTLVPDEGEAAIALVGSRAASALGLAFARRLADELAGAGLVVVSGLARGIDSAAHRGALDARGRTVAVLGSGLDRLYPPENAALAAEVAGERAPGERVSPGHPALEAQLPAPQPRDRRLGAGRGGGRGRVAQRGALDRTRRARRGARRDGGARAPHGPAGGGHEPHCSRTAPRSCAGRRTCSLELGLARRSPARRRPTTRSCALMARDVPERRRRDPAALGARAAGCCWRGSPSSSSQGPFARLPGALFVRARSGAGYTRPWMTRARHDRGRRPRRLRGRVAARAPRHRRRPLRDAPAAADAGPPDGRPRRARVLEQPARQRARPGGGAAQGGDAAARLAGGAHGRRREGAGRQRARGRPWPLRATDDRGDRGAAAREAACARRSSASRTSP